MNHAIGANGMWKMIPQLTIYFVLKTIKDTVIQSLILILLQMNEKIATAYHMTTKHQNI